MSLYRTQLPTRGGDEKGPLKSQTSIPTTARSTDPSLPWKIKHNSSDISTRHQECLTLAATSIAWSPTALRGGRRSVSTQRLSFVTWHSTWHLLSALESQKLLAWEEGRGQHNFVQTCSTLQARGASVIQEPDPRTVSSHGQAGGPHPPGGL